MPAQLAKRPAAFSNDHRVKETIINRVRDRIRNDPMVYVSHRLMISYEATRAARNGDGYGYESELAILDFPREFIKWLDHLMSKLPYASQSLVFIKLLEAIPVGLNLHDLIEEQCRLLLTTVVNSRKDQLEALSINGGIYDRAQALAIMFAHSSLMVNDRSLYGSLTFALTRTLELAHLRSISQNKDWLAIVSQIAKHCLKGEVTQALCLYAENSNYVMSNEVDFALAFLKGKLK